MITLPLFPSEFHAVPNLPEHLMSQDRWTASSEALPAEGIQVFCFLPSLQFHRHAPDINRMHIQDGHWIPDAFDWLHEEYFPLEAVSYWMAMETPPTFDDERWIDGDVRPTQNCDIWIWNDQKKHVAQFWCEGNGKTEVNNCIYYGSAGDPVLHNEYITKWMPCVQPESIEHHFMDQFDSRTWTSVRRLPKWLAAVPAAASSATNRLWWRTKQLPLDL